MATIPNKEFSSIKLPNDVYAYEIVDAKIHENPQGKSFRLDGKLSATGRTLMFTFFVPYDITPKNKHGLLLRAALNRDFSTTEVFDDMEHGVLLRGKIIRLVLEWDNVKERMAVKTILPFKEIVQTSI